MGISDDVRSFVFHYIRSIGQLEILLLLCSSPEREFSAEDVDQELRISVEWAARELEAFCSASFLSRSNNPNPRYRFAPKNGRDRETIAALRKTYTDYRFSIINLIYNRPAEQLGAFARAFKIK